MTLLRPLTMAHRVENRETITDTLGQLPIADDDGGFVGEVARLTSPWGPVHSPAD